MTDPITEPNTEPIPEPSADELIAEDIRTKEVKPLQEENERLKKENQKLRNYLKGTETPDPEPENPFKDYNETLRRNKKHFTPGRGE